MLYQLLQNEGKRTTGSTGTHVDKNPKCWYSSSMSVNQIKHSVLLESWGFVSNLSDLLTAPFYLPIRIFTVMSLWAVVIK